MKNFILSSVFVMACSTLQAQVFVDSVGHVGVGTQTNSRNSLYVYGSDDGIKCTAGNQACSYATAVEGITYNKGAGTTYGVQGIGAWYGSHHGTSFGIYGCAYGSDNGMNYGVYGAVLPMVYGAGIYGASTSYNTLTSFNTHYAGYFDGGVHVQGDVTVTGVVTQPSASASSNHVLSTLQDSYRQTSVANLFGILRPEVYLINRLPAEYSEKGVAQTILADSAIQTMPKEMKLTKMEEQVRSKQHYGLSAEQLEEVFPDLVYEQEDGTKSINYVEMVPILVQAINELNAKIETLENKEEATTKKAMQPATDNSNNEEKLLLLSLSQNKPNPFSNSTTIEVCIPEDVQKAFIYVYDLEGKKVEQVDVTARGKQNIQLTSAKLTDGMYLYSLIADGKVVETRRMIVEK